MERFAKIIGTALFVLVTAVACSDDAHQEQPATVVEALAGDPQFSDLVTYIDLAELTEALSGPGPFTVFAPTNDAFAALPDDFLTNLTLDQLLTYHALGSEVNSAAAISVAESADPNVETLETSPLGLGVDGSTLVLNGRVQVTQPDIGTGNGVIHGIDAVLFPDKDFPGTLVDVLQASPRFSTLLGAVSEAGLAEALAGDNEGNDFTLFAPTNSGFDLLPAGAVEGLVSEGLLGTVLQYHVLGFVANAATAITVAVSPEPTVNTLVGSSVTLSLDAISSLFVNAGSQVTATDITVTNGILHVLDSVLIPEDFIPTFPGNVVQALSSYPRFDGLVAAVVEADLASGLSDVTVFAPTNLAFANANVPPYPDDLSDILLYHVLGTQLEASGLGATETTLEGGDLSFTFGDTVEINGSVEVIWANFIAEDGVIHVIDEVLILSP